MRKEKDQLIDSKTRALEAKELRNRLKAETAKKKLISKHHARSSDLPKSATNSKPRFNLRRIFHRWYAGRVVVIFTLIFLPPLGLLLVWRFTNWSMLGKKIATCFAVLFTALFYILPIFTPPTIMIDNIDRYSTITTDKSQYIISGEVSSLKALRSITLNGESIPVNDDKLFTHMVSLKLGKNAFEIVASNENGTSKESLVIYRQSSTN